MEMYDYSEKLNMFTKKFRNAVWNAFVPYKLELLALLGAAIVVYLPFMAEQLNNADGFMMGVNYHPENYHWEDAQGRFMLRWLDEWRDGLVFPSVIVGIGILLLLLIAVSLWQIFGCTHKTERILIGCFILFSPSVANTLTYYYCADSYMLAYFLAVFAAAFLIKGKRWPSVVAGAVLLFFSLGIYQTYIVATIVICEMWLIIELLYGRDMKWIGNRMLRFLAGGCMGAGFYLFMLALLERFGYLTMTETRGMDNILGNMLLNIWRSVRMAYGVSCDYFFTDHIIFNSWRGRVYFNWMILFGLLVMTGIYVWKKQLWKKTAQMLLLLLLLCIFPMLLSLIVVAAPGASVYAETGMLMLAAMNFAYVLFVLMVSKTGMLLKPPGCGVWNLLFIPGIAVALILTLFIGVFAKVIQLEQRKTEMLVYLMEDRMAEAGEYHAGQKVLVVGRPQWGNYPFTDDTLNTITKGMISSYSLTFGADEQISSGWLQLFQYFGGVRHQECSAEEREQILSSDEIKQMGNFPAETSVKRFGDTLVIKLSEPLRNLQK